MTNFREMTGAELVSFYNQRSDRPVKRFSSHANGVRRCEQLAAKTKVASPKTASPKTSASPKTKKPSASPKTAASPPTLRALTDRFNEMVPAANAKGITWARHHTSLFESRALGERRLAQLQSEIAAAG